MLSDVATRQDVGLVACYQMSKPGQSRRSSHVRVMSALPPTAVGLVRCSETARCATTGRGPNNLIPPEAPVNRAPIEPRSILRAVESSLQYREIEDDALG